MLNTQIGAKKSWNGQYTVDCNTVPNLPDLTLYLGGEPYPLKATDYILNVQGSCLSAFTAMDINLPDGGSIWIVGERLQLHGTTCVASANGYPVQVTSSSAAITQCMISVVTPLDLLKPLKFFHSPFNIPSFTVMASIIVHWQYHHYSRFSPVTKAPNGTSRI